VTGSNVDLGAKRGYEPAAARGRDRSRAAWPAERVRELATVASRLGFAESD
jgi:hypothetical protein